LRSARASACSARPATSAPAHNPHEDRGERPRPPDLRARPRGLNSRVGHIYEMIEAAAPAGTITQAFAWLPPTSEVGAALRSRRRPTPQRATQEAYSPSLNVHARCRLNLLTVRSVARRFAIGVPHRRRAPLTTPILMTPPRKRSVSKNSWCRVVSWRDVGIEPPETASPRNESAFAPGSKWWLVGQLLFWCHASPRV
jgi:hypothetical protein